MPTRPSLLAPIVAAACEAADPATCGGFCGPGTSCVEARCVPAPPATPEPEAAPPERPARPRRRRGRVERPAPGDPPGPPLRVDDSRVPPYQGNRDDDLDAHSGSEHLRDDTARGHMQRLEGDFEDCLARAAAASPELGTGWVEFRLNVEPTGRVSGVTVDAPSTVAVPGLVPCLRVAVHAHRFPTWDGPPARVDYRFRVE